MNAKIACAAIALSACACVSQGKYDEALKSAADARATAQRSMSEAAVVNDANVARMATELRETRSRFDAW